MSKPGNARFGSYVMRNTVGESYQAFVPPKLPPMPALDMPRLRQSLEGVSRVLEASNTIGSLVPDLSLFLYMYVRKEALFSSQIEGTQSSLSDLLLYESDQAAKVPVADVEEVSNYVAALNHGLRRMEEGFPLSSRLIKEIHAILLRGGRGAGKAPGEFRRTQNWIGGTRPGNARFVPPPPEMVNELMSDLERFIHDESSALPVLIKVALVHVQFETIHPFLDGNGRLGRLLITLLLHAEGVLTQPILYLSLHFKQHRDTYYDMLTNVRTKGDWESWCYFFLEGVGVTACQATVDAAKIAKLLARDRDRIGTIGRTAASALKVHDYLLKTPYLSIMKASGALGLSVPTVTNAVRKLVDIGLLLEITGGNRNRLFAYTAYLEILTEGTDPL